MVHGIHYVQISLFNKNRKRSLWIINPAHPPKLENSLARPSPLRSCLWHKVVRTDAHHRDCCSGNRAGNIAIAGAPRATG